MRNRPDSRFCGACGRPLDDSHADNSSPVTISRAAQASFSSAATDRGHAAVSERKWVTVLFSDLTGYSELCRRLDPEDVREMMNLLFKEIVSIIARYEGYIDRIIGDEVLAVFGIPQTHEDDPVRAIRAAVEIHSAVPAMTERFTKRPPAPLAMHSGIATGLVVTGETDPKYGRPGLTGDAIDRASLLTDLAASGEILVGFDTMSATSGFFDFDPYQARSDGRRDESIDAYRMVNVVAYPDKTRRVQGLQARLIGRSGHMSRLHHHVDLMARGQGSCVLLHGAAGTGKSRLIAELKRGLEGQPVRWLQGNAYAFARDIPYLPVIDLFKRIADVRYEDSQEVVRRKLAAELAPLWDSVVEVPQIIERLFTLTNAKASHIPPESWRIQVKQTTIRMIEKQAQMGPTVICIEDLHWADPSTVSLLRGVLNEADLPVFFLLSGRPASLAFDLDEVTNAYYQDELISLDDLPPHKSEEMVRSMLQTDQVPPALLAFIADRLSGNPFFLEEMVNSLVDAGTLVKEKGRWTIRGAIAEAAFSSGISAVIATRLDQLGNSAKRTVQEAAVIGREFSPTVLKQISSAPDRVDSILATLKSLGLILSGMDADENICQFKHALVQEVAYNSLLKQQRRDLHEKIARVLERQHPDRIEALCETLAFHYRNGRSLHKAVDYLQRSGRKGVKKFAIVESHNYYENAYRMLQQRGRSSANASRRTVELLLEWFFVFNMRGRYTDALTLMKAHESEAMDKVDLRLKGMYLACLGWAYQRREQLNASRHCLLEALSIGERIANYKVIAYSCAGLIWTYTDLGRLDEALTYAAKAEESSRLFDAEDPEWSFEMDQDLIRFVLTGTAIAHWFRGDCRQCRVIADRLLAYGQAAGDVNSISEGHLAHGMARFAAGNYRAAVGHCLTAIERSSDPLYAFNARFLLAYAYLSMGDVAPAEKHLDGIMQFCARSGYEYLGTSATALSNVVAAAKGHLWSGVTSIERHVSWLQAEGKLYHAQTFHLLLGTIYLRLVLREGGLGMMRVLINLPFFAVYLPQAARKAEFHLNTAIRMAGRIHALGIKGQALFELGRLHQTKGRHDLAVALIKQSMGLFEQLGADTHRKRAQAALARVGS